MQWIGFSSVQITQESQLKSEDKNESKDWNKLQEFVSDLGKQWEKLTEAGWISQLEEEFEPKQVSWTSQPEFKEFRKSEKGWTCLAISLRNDNYIWQKEKKRYFYVCSYYIFIGQWFLSNLLVSKVVIFWQRIKIDSLSLKIKIKKLIGTNYVTLFKKLGEKLILLNVNSLVKGAGIGLTDGQVSRQHLFLNWVQDTYEVKNKAQDRTLVN